MFPLFKNYSFQIYQEAKKFGKVYNIKVVCAYGGGNMWEQVNACQEMPEIIVCTPVRFELLFDPSLLMLVIIRVG
jgi:ATP-dependent RNA helicase DDX42